MIVIASLGDSCLTRLPGRYARSEYHAHSSCNPASRQPRDCDRQTAGICSAPCPLLASSERLRPLHSVTAPVIRFSEQNSVTMTMSLRAAEAETMHCIARASCSNNNYGGALRAVRYGRASTAAGDGGAEPGCHSNSRHQRGFSRRAAHSKSQNRMPITRLSYFGIMNASKRFFYRI